MSHAAVPPQKPSGSWLGRLKNGNGNGHARHFSISKAQIERAQNVVHSSLAELSIDCEYVEDGRILYDAQNVLGLFSGPSHEATEEIVGMMDNTFAERVPGAGRRKGTYPGRTSDTISVTVMVCNLGQGAAMDKVAWFYKEATRIMGDIRDKRVSREQRWDEVTQAGQLLPNL